MTFPFFGQGAATPVQVLIGRGRPSFDISQYIDLANGGLTIEDTGNQADDTASITLVDRDRNIDDIGPEAAVLIKTGTEERFRGFIRSFEPIPFTVSNRITIQCVGLSSLADKCIIPPGSAYTRKKSESDRARILWLLSTFGQPLLKWASNDFSKIQVLESNMERQKFGSLTLRQAIEQVLGAASESANYYFDQGGRLHTFDDDNPEADTAPYEINTTGSPAANEAVPENLRVAWDTTELINFYVVRGSNRAGSGQFSDEDSINLYGRREGFIDGPDSDTTRKARRLGRAALHDTANPMPRVAFTVSERYVTNAGAVWAPGQEVYITAPGLGWVHHSERIIRVTTRYLDSTGRRAMDIEAGALKRSLNSYAGGGGGGGGGGGVGPPGFIPGGPTVSPDPEFGTGGGGGGACCEPTMTDMLFDGFDRFANSSLGTLPIPDTDLWDGGNTWTFNGFPAPATTTAGTDGSVFYVTGSDADGDVNFNLNINTTDAELPFAQGEWSIMGRFRIDFVGQPSLSGDRVFELGIGAFNRLFIYFGDGTNAAGIRVAGNDAVVKYRAKGISANTWHRFRFTKDETDPSAATGLHARFWREDEQEPTEWDVEDGLSNDPDSSTVEMMVSVGAPSPAATQRFELDWLKVFLGQTEGLVSTDTFTGDGSTTTYALSQQASSLRRVDVDGVLVNNVVKGTVTTDDGVVYIRRITFDAAPASGADITVEYVIGRA